MNKPQIIETPQGEKLVVLSMQDYEEMLEDAADIAAYDKAKRRLAAGEDEMIPAEIVGRLLDGGNPVRVWREYRGLTIQALAGQSGLSKSYVSQIETGQRDGTAQSMLSIARSLGVDLEDLINTTHIVCRAVIDNDGKEKVISKNILDIKVTSRDDAKEQLEKYLARKFDLHGYKDEHGYWWGRLNSDSEKIYRFTIEA